MAAACSGSMERAQSQWFAVQVRGGCEQRLVHTIRNIGYKVFCPTYVTGRTGAEASRKVEKPLFRGYLFCQIDGQLNLPRLVARPGVIRILGDPRRESPLDPAELDYIRTLASAGQALLPCPFLRVGQQVKVVNGCLKGVEGKLVALRSGHRLVLSITLLQRSVCLEVEHSSVAEI